MDGLGVKIVGGWLKDGCIDGIDRWFVFGLLDGWMDVRLVVRCTVGWIVGGDYCLDEYMEVMMNR